MKLFDPIGKKDVEVVEKTFALKMKAGTKGTFGDPHVPIVEDLLEGIVFKWVINDTENTITVWATPQNLARVAKTQREIK